MLFKVTQVFTTTWQILAKTCLALMMIWSLRMNQLNILNLKMFFLRFKKNTQLFSSKSQSFSSKTQNKKSMLSTPSKPQSLKILMVT